MALKGTVALASMGRSTATVKFPTATMRPSVFSIRLARAFGGVAAPLRGDFSEVKPEPIHNTFDRDVGITDLSQILGDMTLGMGLIGPPGSGKTTLLRDIGFLSSVPPEMGGYGLDQLCVVVDSSNELGGYGDVPHPALGHALRIQVGDPKSQANKIKIAIRNLTCRRLVLDEIGYNNDVEQVQSCANLGVGVLATLHGHNLADALGQSSILAPLRHV